MADPRNEILALDKIMRALKLRREGKTVTSIAHELGFSTKVVSRMLAEGLRALQSELQDESEVMRADIHARLDWAAEKLSPEVELGKPFAIEKWISLHMSMAKLYGLLDADTKTPALQQNNLTIINNNNNDKPAIPDAGAIRAARILQAAADRLERQLAPPVVGDIVEGQVKEIR